MLAAAVLAATLSAAAVVVICVIVAPLEAQQPTFSARRETVRVDVLVTENRRPIRGLQAADFEILDGGVVQQVDFVSFEQLPLAVVLALDGSVSISAAALEHLRAGSRALLDNVRPEDQAALLTFADAISLRTGLSRDVAPVRAALERFAPSPQTLGGTALIDACYTALTVLERDPGRGLVIVFTDGIDTASWLPGARVLEAARRSNAVVYAVSTAQLPRRSFLRDLTEATGGGAIEIATTGDVAAAFVRILDEFRQRYVVGFSPAADGAAGWHPLTVRVKGRRVVVQARAGYAR